MFHRMMTAADRRTVKIPVSYATEPMSGLGNSTKAAYTHLAIRHA